MKNYRETTEQLQSVMYWRKSNIKHTINEAYFDIKEELDCIIDKQGNILDLQINGMVRSLKYS
jgi:hypothetical protein